MANTLKFGNGEWYGKKDTILAYNDENSNYKPLPFDFSRASKATVINKDGLIETVGSGQPRIDYKDDSKGALLLEPSRSNLVTYSEDLTNDWTRNGINNPTDVNSIAPDGASTVKRLQTNNSDGSISFSYNTGYSQVDGTTYTVSVYAKSNTNENQIFGLFGNGSGSSNNHSGNLIATSEWKRFTYTYTAGNTSTIGFCKGNDRLSFDILMWGFQVEIGSYATSYIPTQGSTVTRLADVCNNGGNEQVIGQTEGVFYVDLKKGFTPSAFEYISLSDGTTSNTIRIFFNTSNQIGVVVGDSGATQVNSTYSNIYSESENLKVAFKYKANDFSLWVNGQEVITDNSGTVPSVNSLNFGRGDTTSTWYEKTREIKLYNTALTDAELIALTS